MTTYNHSTDIPPSARTSLEALAVWVGMCFWTLYQNQRYKEVEGQDPILAAQISAYRSPSENNREFISIRLNIPMATDWTLQENKPWANAQPFPNSASITGNGLLAGD
jgi:hypothetical protein